MATLYDMESLRGSVIPVIVILSAIGSIVLGVKQNCFILETRAVFSYRCNASVHANTVLSQLPSVLGCVFFCNFLDCSAVGEEAQFGLYLCRFCGAVQF